MVLYNVHYFGIFDGMYLLIVLHMFVKVKSDKGTFMDFVHFGSVQLTGLG